MKLNRYILLLLLFFAGKLFSQQEGKGANKEKIKAMRIAFITQKLNLTSQEAQSFWPIYNECQQKIDDLRNDFKQTQKNGKQNIDEMTDKEAEAYIDAEMAYKQKIFDLQKDLHKKLKAILSAKKIALLYRAEKQFTNLVLEGAMETPKKGKK